MQTIALPRYSKPPIGTQLDLTSELANGLFYFAPLWECGGSTAADVAGRGYAALTTATWTAGSRSAALNCSAGTPQYAAQTIPASLQFAAWPATIAVGFRFLAGRSGSPNFFGLGYASTNTNPYDIIAVGQYTSGTLAASFNSAGTSHFNGPYFTLAAKTEYVVSYSVGPANQDLYLNGSNISSLTTAVSAPHWTSTSRYLLGDQYGGSGPGALIYWAAAWTRYLTPGEHALMAQNPWQVFQPALSVAALSQNIAPAQLKSSVPVRRPVADYTGSRRVVWAE